jgi:NitT/TauT family transport system substrate-binding protein
MQIIQSRRDLLAGLAAASAASIVRARTSLADERPPETATIRIQREEYDNAICLGPEFVAEELLRAEGFTDVQYVVTRNGEAFTEAFARGEIDFGFMFAPGAVRRIDDGVPITVVAGVHPGCFELFVHEPVQTVTDLKGRRVGVPDLRGGPPQLYVSIMAAHVGLDPERDIDWITTDDVARPMELFVRGEIDAYLAFVTDFPELHDRKIGRPILNMAMDKPWSQSFCCLWVGNADFVREHPVATKRALSAVLKATDLCRAEPERAVRQMVDGGFIKLDDERALQALAEIPWASWRELDPEDTLRFYALWMHEFGQLNATPNRLIAEGTDWRFLNELKRELKA